MLSWVLLWIIGVWGWEVHARAESERIRIQHWIIRPETMVAGSKWSPTGIDNIRRRSRRWRLALRTHGYIRQAEIRNELVFHYVIRGSVVQQFRLSIEILTCAQQISRGPSSSTDAESPEGKENGRAK